MSRDWVLYDGEDWRTFETEAEAVTAADQAIDEWREACDPFWPEEVEGIFVAHVTHEIGRTTQDVLPFEAPDGVTEIWDYGMRVSDSHVEHIRIFNSAVDLLARMRNQHHKTGSYAAQPLLDEVDAFLQEHDLA